jgi:hypothetical protein
MVASFDELGASQNFKLIAKSPIHIRTLSEVSTLNEFSSSSYSLIGISADNTPCTLRLLNCRADSGLLRMGLVSSARKPSLTTIQSKLNAAVSGGGGSQIFFLLFTIKNI